MMKKTIAIRIVVGLFLISSIALTACQEQELDRPSAVPPAATTATPKITAIPQAKAPTSVVDNFAIKDLLNRVVRPDLPGMTFEQVKALFPTTCVANDDNRNIACPDVAGLVSISYAGGPDGTLDMVFTGGMASCKMLQALIGQKLGTGEDISEQDKDGVCDVKWWAINPKYKTYHANIGKLSRRDHVTFQIGSEDTVGP